MSKQVSCVCEGKFNIVILTCIEISNSSSYSNNCVSFKRREIPENTECIITGLPDCSSDHYLIGGVCTPADTSVCTRA